MDTLWYFITCILFHFFLLLFILIFIPSFLLSLFSCLSILPPFYLISSSSLFVPIPVPLFFLLFVPFRFFPSFPFAAFVLVSLPLCLFPFHVSFLCLIFVLFIIFDLSPFSLFFHLSSSLPDGYKLGLRMQIAPRLLTKWKAYNSY